MKITGKDVEEYCEREYIHAVYGKKLLRARISEETDELEKNITGNQATTATEATGRSITTLARFSTNQPNTTADALTAAIETSSIGRTTNRTLEKRVEILEKEVHTMKKIVANLNNKAKDSAEHAKTETPDAEELLASVAHFQCASEKEVTEIIRRIMFRVFSKNDILNCSRTGKKTHHSPLQARPCLAPEKLQLVETVGMTKCFLSREQFYKKFNNIVKMERRAVKTKLDRDINF